MAMAGMLGLTVLALPFVMLAARVGRRHWVRRCPVERSEPHRVMRS
jgi:hypothetical protein